MSEYQLVKTIASIQPSIRRRYKVTFSDHTMAWTMGSLDLNDPKLVGAKCTCTFDFKTGRLTAIKVLT